MAKGVMCQCGCRKIITEINPKTDRPYSGCEKSRSEKIKRNTKSRNRHRKEKMDYARTGRGSLIYDTQAWRRLSNKKRTVDPFCEDCLDNGKYVIANVVDHIVEVKDDISLAYVWNNLRSLCHACHNKKTANESNNRKDRGVYDIDFV